MKQTLIFAFMFLISLLGGCQNQNTATQIDRPSNIILLIGDGMGLTQIQAGMIASDENLQIERFPVVGLSKTSASDNLITDSAAGATAMACGIKTYNGAIGVNTKGKACKTILEMSEEAGMSTGLVATSTITHATPASFISHVDQRSKYEEIALGFLETDIDLFIGGGKDHFDNRRDGRVLTEEFKNKGYSVIDSLSELEKGLPKKLIGLLNPKSMPSVIDGRGDMLPASSQLAIDLLSANEKGFFLMVEGSQIDWGGHDNNIEYVVTEMLDFDSVIGAVLDFASKDQNTLVILTADHETGGLTVKGENILTDSTDFAFSTGGHTPVMVPVFAYGPGAQQFTGVYENTEIFTKMKMLLGL